MATHRLARWVGATLSILLSIVFASGCTLPSAAPSTPGPTPTLRVTVQGETPGRTEPVQATGQPAKPPQPISEEPPYDCLATVSATRPLMPNGTGDDCWLTLSDGGSTELTFYDDAQVTLRTTFGGNDIFFFSVSKGDRLIKVIGATIRPARYIELRFGGSIENVKQFEIASHSPGSPNGRPACLRDANNDYRPLTSLCK
jgi:hypothetical protein